MPITQTLKTLHAEGLSRFAPVLTAMFLCIPVIMVCDHRSIRRIVSVAVVPNPVHPGEGANLVFSAIDSRACYGKTTRRIVDSKGLEFLLSDEPAEYSADVGKSRTFVRDLPIPKGVSTGGATYRGHVERWCNTLQYWFWPLTNDTVVKFQVTK